MRVRLPLLLLAAGLTAGCAGDNEKRRWAGPGTALGPLPVERFEAVAVDVDADWEHAPVQVAAEFVRVDRVEARTVSVVARQEGEGGPTALAEVVLDGLLDDSIRARRIVLELQRRDDGTWRVASAVATQRCQPERGHENFSIDPCV
jgi:CO/xanthine dehydrogenase FAD-binding subunit